MPLRSAHGSTARSIADILRWCFRSFLPFLCIIGPYSSRKSPCGSGLSRFSQWLGEISIFCWACGVVILLVSVFISLCRGGIIAVSLSLFLFFGVLARKRSRYSSLFYIGVIAFLIFSVTWFGWDPILQRFEQIFKATGELNIDRFPVWRDTLSVFKDFWLTGSGFRDLHRYFRQV